MTPSRRRICRPLIRSNFNSFAGTATKNSATRQAIIKILGRKLQSEVASLCSTNLKSVLAEKPHDGMGNFINLINTLMEELVVKAPTLLSLLKWALKTRRARQNYNTIIAVIISIIGKNRKTSVCLFQRIVSLILYTGHSNKQVSMTI